MRITAVFLSILILQVGAKASQIDCLNFIRLQKSIAGMYKDGGEVRDGYIQVKDNSRDESKAENNYEIKPRDEWTAELPFYRLRVKTNDDGSRWAGVSLDKVTERQKESVSPKETVTVNYEFKDDGCDIKKIHVVKKSEKALGASFAHLNVYPHMCEAIHDSTNDYSYKLYCNNRNLDTLYSRGSGYGMSYSRRKTSVDKLWAIKEACAGIPLVGRTELKLDEKKNIHISPKDGPIPAPLNTPICQALSYGINTHKWEFFCNRKHLDEMFTMATSLEKANPSNGATPREFTRKNTDMPSLWNIHLACQGLAAVEKHGESESAKSGEEGTR